MTGTGVWRREVAGAPRLVVASRNRGKLREMQRLFRVLAPQASLALVSADEVGLPEIEETGSSFLENARLKALAAAQWTGALSLGEDSGLEVDVLGGEPGVRSHRFSSTGDDLDNNLLLLRRLEGIPRHLRTARYRCAMAVADAGGIVAEGEGVVEGIIAEEMSGTSGFGYDPLFYSTELRKTMGQASDQEKDSVSHRRRALERILPALLRYVGRGCGPESGPESGPDNGQEGPEEVSFS